MILIHGYVEVTMFATPNVQGAGGTGDQTDAESKELFSLTQM